MMLQKVRKFIYYTRNTPWWEKEVRDMEAFRNGWVEERGCLPPDQVGKLPHRVAHIVTAYYSAFCVTDGCIKRGRYAGQLYSPAATFHWWHKRLGGHGRGAY